MQKILLIEDEDTVRAALTEVLRRAGFAVIAAKQGREGLDRFRKDSADAVVTDILMPVQDGIETIIALRRISVTLPILAICSGGSAGGVHYLNDALAFGANLALTKPVNAEDFVGAVTALLADRKKQIGSA